MTGSKGARRIMSAAEAAEAASVFGGAPPDDVHLITFLVGVLGDSYSAAVASTLPPAQIATVLREWLDRYERGEA